MTNIVERSVNGVPYKFELRAAERLEAFERSLQQRFAQQKDGGEVLENFYERIQELVANSLMGEKNIVTETDIQKIVARLSSDEPEEPVTRSTKRLVRRTDKALIAGVCAGLADYFDIDTTLVRVLTFALVFVSGIAIPVYIILWIVTPTNDGREQPPHQALLWIFVILFLIFVLPFFLWVLSLFVSWSFLLGPFF